MSGPSGVPLSFSSPVREEAKLPDVGELMLRTKEGTPRAVLANALTALRFDPEWSGVLAFDEFSLYAVAKKPPPWDKPAGSNWTDHDDTKAADWLQHCGILVNSKTASEAAQAVAKENSFHPVKDYLNGLTWDQKPRLDSWLTTYLGVEKSAFSHAVGSRWLVSAIARVFRPGCQVDHTLLLEGPQGIRKSTALRTLASDEWFADHISDLGSKDSRIELHGKWIFEISELDRVRRGEIERIKAFLSARFDHFRVPYGRRAEDVPRSCIFAASTNDSTPFTDETGNRRFWPVLCSAIDIESLARDRDQLWAEACTQYKAGAVWWLETTELNSLAREEQDQRFDAGVWDDVILAWTDEPKQREESDDGNRIPIEPFDSNRDRVTLIDALVHGVGKELDRCTQNDKNQVARCLIRNGWKRKQDGKGQHRGKWFYLRPEVAE